MTLRLDVVSPKHMATTGRALLKILQASKVPPLDLLARESIQNSLDAAKPDVDHVHVDFDFHYPSTHSLGAFANHLPEIREALLSRIDDRHTVLEIRDSNTVGLTGALVRRAGVRDGNLLKLVYDISSPQERVNAGGSWGLGKTCYYRMGMGLVVYYSRVRLEDGNYESRLVVCLVENLEKDPDALLSGHGVPNNTGIAWWGAREHETGQSMPITDEPLILDILNSLGVSPFEPFSSGTCVIIPFLRSDLTESHQLAWEEGERREPWSIELVENLQIAIQRWYAPRVNNPDYGQGPSLRVSVGGSPLGVLRISPLAQIMKLLYRSTPAAARGASDRTGLRCEQSGVEEIRLRSAFAESGLAGWVAWAVMTPQQLGMDPPHNNPPPSALVRGKRSQRNPPDPILAMIRSPGMIIRFAASGEDWLRGIQCPEGFHVIALFVLNGSQTLVVPGREGNTLESYVRETELAAHDEWFDLAGGFNILDKIKKGVNRKLRGVLTPAEQPTGDERQVGGSQFLGRLLMPDGFGEEPTVPPRGKPPGSGGGGGRNGTRFIQRNVRHVVEHDQRFVCIEFELQAGREKTGNLLLKVAGGGTAYSESKWTKEGMAFPFEWDRVHIERIEFSDSDRGLDAIGEFPRSINLSGTPNENEAESDIVFSHGNGSQTADITVGWSDSVIGCSVFGEIRYRSRRDLMAKLQFKRGT